MFNTLRNGGIIACASHQVTDLLGVNQSITAVPEIEQVEDFIDICEDRRKSALFEVGEELENSTVLPSISPLDSSVVYRRKRDFL